MSDNIWVRDKTTGLQIGIDEDSFQKIKRKCRLYEHHGDRLLDRNKEISTDELLAQINELHTFAKNIMLDAPQTGLLRHLPQTKCGRLYKTRNVLLFQSRINRWRQNDINITRYVLQLRLTTLKWNTGCCQISLEWRPASQNESPILNADGTLRPIFCARTRHNYIREQQLVPGRIYQDANQNSWLYLGKYLIDYDLLKGNMPVFATEDQYKRSSVYAKFQSERKTTPPLFLSIKLNQKISDMIVRSRTLGDFLENLFITFGRDWPKHISSRRTAPSFIRCACGPSFDSNAMSGFYSLLDTNGKPFCTYLVPTQNLMRNGGGTP